jgi:hypothetical protein
MNHLARIVLVVTLCLSLQAFLNLFFYLGKTPYTVFQATKPGIGTLVN